MKNNNEECSLTSQLNTEMNTTKTDSTTTKQKTNLNKNDISTPQNYYRVTTSQINTINIKIKANPK